MMTRKYLLAGALAVAAFVLPGFGQTAKSPFDADLAKKVGADDLGMRSFVLAILKTGPNDRKVAGEARKKLMEGHMANIRRLAEEGKLAVAGPFGTNDKQFRGLFIFAVDSVDAARELASTDPTVKAGVFTVDYVPWYGSASLMLVTDLHSKIARENF